LLFCYSCFLKPHSSGAKGGQQDALESFYAGQAGAVCLYCPRGIEPTQLTSTSTM
jgi:hypothetical protein